MAFTMRRSSVDPDLFEIWDEEKVVQEIPVLFSIRKYPSSFESLEEIEKWLTEREWKLARFAAYRLIAMRNYPSVQLLRKLEQKRFSSSICNRVIEELQNNGYLKDEEFVQSSILRELKRGFGPRYIEMKLRAKGLSGEKIRYLITPEMQAERIRQLIAKTPLSKSIANRLAKQKAIRNLQRRGFDLDLILKELN